MNPISVRNYSQYQNYNNSYGQYGGSSSPYYGTPQEDVGVEPAKTVGLAALLQAAAIGVHKASEYFSKKLSAGKEFTSSDNVVKIAKEMVSKNKLTTAVEYIDDANKSKYFSLGQNTIEEVARGRNAFFHPGANLAVAPKSKPSLILHELGHAINSKKGTFMGLLQKARRYVPFAPMALLVANRLFSNETDGKKSFVEKHAGILGFSASIPILVEEASASLRGINAAKKALVNPANLKLLKKNYAFAWCTYLLGAVAMGIACKQTIIQESK